MRYDGASPAMLSARGEGEAEGINVVKRLIMSNATQARIFCNFDGKLHCNRLDTGFRASIVEVCDVKDAFRVYEVSQHLNQHSVHVRPGYVNYSQQRTAVTVLNMEAPQWVSYMSIGYPMIVRWMAHSGATIY